MRTGEQMRRRTEVDSVVTLVTLLALLTPAASAYAQGDAYPGSSWEPGEDPASLGWSIEGLGRARAYADDQHRSGDDRTPRRAGHGVGRDHCEVQRSLRQKEPSLSDGWDLRSRGDSRVFRT